MIRFGFSPVRVMVWAVLFVVSTCLAMLFIPQWWWQVSLVLAIVWLFPTVIEVGGAAFSDAIRRTRLTSQPYIPARIREVDGTGVLLEGSDVVCVWMEVTPRDEVDVTVVSGDGVVSRPVLDIAKMAPMMNQRDVVVESLVVTTMAYSSYLPGYTAGNAVVQSMGTLHAPLGGRTWVMVRARVEDNVRAASMRSTGDEDFDDGMIAAVLSTVARLRVVIEEGGHHVSVLSPEMVAQVSSMVQAGTGRILDKARTRFFGTDESSLKAYALYPRRSVSRAQVAAWRNLPGIRSFTTTRVTPSSLRGGPLRVRDRVVLVTRDKAALSKARKAGLTVLKRQQRQAATWLVPAVVSQPVAQPDFAMKDPYPVVHYGGGVGMFVGSTSAGGSVFVRVRPGTGKTLHLIGDTDSHQILIMRLMMESHSVNIALGEDASEEVCERWRTLVKTLNSPLLAYGSSKSSDFIVTTPEGHASAKSSPTQCVVVVSETTPTMSLEYSIRIAGSAGVVTTDKDQQKVFFAPSPSEKSFVAH